MSNLLLLRADASPVMGTGHVMRCLALAAAWQNGGGRAVLVTHGASDSLCARGVAYGVTVVRLSQAEPEPEAVAASLAEARSHYHQTDADAPAWCVLDGYQFTPEVSRAVRHSGCRVLALDDLAEAPNRHADVILNQNLGAERLAYPVGDSTLLLLGSRYALLRPEFLHWSDLRRETPLAARRLLVTLGGADPQNLTLRVLEAVAQARVPQLHTRAVIGPANRHAERLRTWHAASGAHVELLFDVVDMPSLMAWADMAISAAGSTCWELAYMQVPTLSLVMAENQERIARQLDHAGVAEQMGWGHRLARDDIARTLRDFAADLATRANQAEAGRRVIDGQGARRVAMILQALTGLLPHSHVVLRRAVQADRLALWRLANDPTVRRTALSEAEISADEFAAWYDRKLALDDSRTWVLDFQGLVLGQIRYDRKPQRRAEISIAVAAPFRRRGLGLRMLEQTRETVARELRVDRLRAIIRQENAPSQRTFRKAGYRFAEALRIEGHDCHVFESVL